MPPIAGVQLATHAAGIKYEGRDDLFLATVAAGTTVAGTFTRSQCPSAPVDWCRRILADGTRTARALVCNSGNANAFTGRAGGAAATLTADTIADALGVLPAEIFLASTGVIGEPLPEQVMRDGLPLLADKLDTSSPDGWELGAAAICTTDTYPKGAYARIEGCAAHIVGIAKGSGMIAPDMATRLPACVSPVAAMTSMWGWVEQMRMSSAPVNPDAPMIATLSMGTTLRPLECLCNVLHISQEADSDSHHRGPPSGAPITEQYQRVWSRGTQRCPRGRPHGPTQSRSSRRMAPRQTSDSHR